jgi:hypothetical protein
MLSISSILKSSANCSATPPPPSKGVKFLSCLKFDNVDSKPPATVYKVSCVLMLLSNCKAIAPIDALTSLEDLPNENMFTISLAALSTSL